MLPCCAVRACHVLVLVLCLSAAEDFDWTKNDRGSFYYGTFPAGFSWGAGSSAYQTEGAWDEDGKGLSIWDVFSHKKGKILQNDTGDSSCQGYYKVKEDISLMKELRLNHYRFSISWPRILSLPSLPCTTGIYLRWVLINRRDIAQSQICLCCLDNSCGHCHAKDMAMTIFIYLCIYFTFI
uniref:Lactase-like b n=1 Tax=Hucho hucho TaxID=62062 RepID=A0A4W5K9V5_9TELE